MKSLTQAVELAELEKLARNHGGAPYRHRRLEVDHPFLTGVHQQLVRDARRAEICYVMHRGDPGTGVLLHIKRFYPEGAYRLPTGGVQVGEAVVDALAREIREETGLEVSPGTENSGRGTVVVERFLGVLSYELVHRGEDRTYAFATYHFLVKAPATVVLSPQDPEEQIAGWQWRLAAALGQVADTLDAVYRKTPEWGDWGRFRALSHRFVAGQLGARPNQDA